MSNLQNFIFILPEEKPDLDSMGQANDLILFFKSDDGAYTKIGFYDVDAKDTGWMESGTFEHLPIPFAWMRIDMACKFALKLAGIKAFV